MRGLIFFSLGVSLLGGCAALGMTPMGDGTVVTSDGSVLPVADAVTAVGSAAGSIVGVPWVGSLLGGLVTAFLSNRANKS